MNENIRELNPYSSDRKVPSFRILDSKTLIREKTISSGAYGVIYTAILKENNNLYAVKQNNVDKTGDFHISIREMDIHLRLNGHPFINPLKGVSFGNPFENGINSKIDSSCKKDILYFLYDPAAYDGYDLIYTLESNFKKMKVAMIQFLLGLEYMHSKNIIHRDLKPSNILWFRGKENNRSFKLCDFGLSKPLCSMGSETPRVVTISYRSPEIAFGFEKYDTKSDVWSAGCIFYEMITKSLLINLKDDSNSKLLIKIFSIIPRNIEEQRLKEMDSVGTIYKNIKNIKNIDKTWEECLSLSKEKIKDFNDSPGSYEDFLDLLSHIVEIDPKKRFTATEALNHKFFENNKNYIESMRIKFPPVSDDLPLISINSCKEREWIKELVMIYFSENNKKWYKDRILFMGIDIFDRYLNYIYCDENKIFDSDISKRDKINIEFKFEMCMYLAYKYFNIMVHFISFKEFSKKRYDEKYHVKFEMFLIWRVLDLKIYRPTLYDIAENLEKDDVEKLLVFLCKLKTENLYINELYSNFKKLK